MAAAGTIFDLKKFAIHDGPGIRTTVFLRGCPLDCWWCHNPEGRSTAADCGLSMMPGAPSASIIRLRNMTTGSAVTAEAVMEEVMKDEIFYDQSGGGVTFSGGEPMMQLEFLASLLGECRRRAVHTTVDTSGYVSSEDFAEIYDLVDLFLFDLKIMDEDGHVQYTGVSNRLIHNNLIALASRGEKLIVRMPMVPGVTDTRENLDAVAAFLKPLKNVRNISLLPYNRLGEDKAERHKLREPRKRWQPPTAEDMDRRRKWLESAGYTVRIGG